MKHSGQHFTMVEFWNCPRFLQNCCQKCYPDILRQRPVTWRTWREKQRNQTTIHIRKSSCSVSVYRLWFRQEVSRTWSMGYKQPFDLMNNGGVCPRTYSKYGNLARLIWRWLMDWYLNFNAGQCKFRTDVQGCSAKSVFKVGNVLTQSSPPKKGTSKFNEQFNMFQDWKKHFKWWIIYCK